MGRVRFIRLFVGSDEMRVQSECLVLAPSSAESAGSPSQEEQPRDDGRPHANDPSNLRLDYKLPSCVFRKAVPRKSQCLVVLALDPDLAERQGAKYHETKNVPNGLTEKEEEDATYD